MLDFDSFEILSFDCYGTLVDWETGLLAALRPILRHHGRDQPSDERLLEEFARLEAAAESAPYRSYAVVLREVVGGLGQSFGFEPDDEERGALAASIALWPPFPDTKASLAALRSKYRLAIISNIDDDLFAGTARALGVPFDFIVTAGQVGAYKPSLENFRQALARFRIPREKVLHVAQSLYHDIAPARSLGLACVWVNRRRDRPGPGATPPATARPDLEVPDLETLVRCAGLR